MQFDLLFGALFMFAWVFFSMSVMMNLFMIIIGDSFEVVQDTHKFNWLTDVNNFCLNSLGTCSPYGQDIEGV